MLHRASACNGLEDSAMVQSLTGNGLGTFFKVRACLTWICVTLTKKACIICSLQGPTAPDDVYELLMELMEGVDGDAVTRNQDEETAMERPLVRIRPYPAGVSFQPGSDDKIKESNLKAILKLPYQDMKIVLTDVLRHDAARKQVCGYVCV